MRARSPSESNLRGLDRRPWPGQAPYSYLLKKNIESPTMASTSLSLGEHWESFIKREVASGRYGSASEVIRDALRHMEERNSMLAALRAHLAEGEAQALNGEIVEDYSIEALLAESDREA
jgi:antitoxin ParD1/3/4